MNLIKHIIRHLPDKSIMFLGVIIMIAISFTIACWHCDVELVRAQEIEEGR